MTDPHPTSPGYDTSTINVRRIFIFIIWFLSSLALILLFIWQWEARLLARQTHADPRVLFPEVPPLPQPLQPSPAHPALPSEDLAAFRSSSQSQLHSTGPLPHDPSHIHIPVDQAIDQLLRSGEFNRPWQNPTTQPFQRPPAETNPSVENRT